MKVATVVTTAGRWLLVCVGTKEFRNRLTYYLRLVREGGLIVVTDRGKPVAEVRRPGPRSETDEIDARLATLAAEGLIVLPRTSGLERFEPVEREGIDLSAAVLEDRR